MAECCITPDKVQEAFLAAPPLISQQILDLTVKHPNWLRDVFETEEWPRGAGTVMEQLVFRGAMPQIERGWEQWKKISNLSGCEPCAAPDCSYNWTMFGGHGFERKLTELMQREFRSPSYCINEIQTTAHFKEVFAKIVENLYRQVDFFKEMNIGLNLLTSLAKKYVVDSGGPQPNTANPYRYRRAGTARLSTLNMQILEFFYEHMRRLPDAIPYDVVDGAPIYSLLASHQLLARMYRDDPGLRLDVRFSGLANDLLTKYNFMSTIRGMFIAAPILFPRRFILEAGTGEPLEVLPFVNGVPAEVGSYTYLNPDYESATHEEVIIHGKSPFKVFHMPTETSLGESASFGPEFSFLNSWMWINPLTVSDPFRRVGYFASSAKIGLSQQFSEGVYGILVERPRATIVASYTPEPVCPPVPTVCDNTVPSVACPCPLVTSVAADPFHAGYWVVTFASAVNATVGQYLDLKLDDGTVVNTGVSAITTDKKTLALVVLTPVGADLSHCNVVGLDCGSTSPCSATVTKVCDCRAGEGDGVKLTLSNAIRAEVEEEVLAYFGDCTTAMLEIQAIEGLVYTMTYAEGYGPTDDPTGEGTRLEEDLVCDRGGISRICVPPSTDATCPACVVSSTSCSCSGGESCWGGYGGFN